MLYFFLVKTGAQKTERGQYETFVGLLEKSSKLSQGCYGTLESVQSKYDEVASVLNAYGFARKFSKQMERA